MQGIGYNHSIPHIGGIRNMFYKICPVCGAMLDPGERCDCEREGRRGMDEYTVQPRQHRRATDGMDFCPPPDSYAVPRRAVLEA